MRTFRLAGCVLWCLAPLAWADIPPPDIGGCQGKEVGASCQRDDGSPGTCAKSTCTRNDYSEGPPPKRVAYECLRCEASAPPPVVDAGAAEGPKKANSCAAVPGSSLAALGAWLACRRRRGGAPPARGRPSPRLMSPRLAFVLVSCAASLVLADIPPANSESCLGQVAGAACTTDDGLPGTCVEQLVSRPDYSNGPPPTYKQVKMLICVASSTAKARSPSMGPLWTGLVLALLAGAAAWALRRPGARAA